MEISEKDTLYTGQNHNSENPDPWLAIYLDQSVPIDPEAKKAWINSTRSQSRQFVLPLLRPFFRLATGIVQIYKTVFPNAFTSSKLLHHLIVWGMKTFGTPEANFLILRHFWLGTQVLKFLSQNIQGVNIPSRPLCPMTVNDLLDDLFVKHDINLFNFVIYLNNELKAKTLKIEPKDPLDFSMIENPNLKLDSFQKKWTNVVDLETAVELYALLFQLLLSDDDYWRASNSLQLDETIGVYYAQVLKRSDRLFMVNNKHPLIPNIIGDAARRLCLHGLSTEMLHGFLIELRDIQLKENLKFQVSNNKANDVLTSVPVQI